MVEALAVGDRVIVGSVADVRDDIVLLATEEVVPVVNPAPTAPIMFFETTAARDAALPAPTSPTFAWVDDDLTLYVWSDEGTPGWKSIFADIVLDELGDVTITTPATGHVLRYNGTAWVNVATLDMLAAATSTDVFTIQISPGPDTQKRLIINGDGKIEWGDGSNAVDTDLFRQGTGILGTTSAFRSERSAVGDSAFNARVGTETTARWAVQADGKTEWGPGGASARDTNLYRSAANELATDDDFIITPTSGRVAIGGSASSANFTVYRGASTDLVFSSRVTGDGENRFNINTAGALRWGSGAGSTDVNLYRDVANKLKTDDDLHVVGQLTVDGGIDAPDHARLSTTNSTDDAGFSHTSYATNQSCGIAFTAPPSGAVVILWHVRGEANTAGDRFLAGINVKTGSTVGSGTAVVSASDSRAIEMTGSNRIQAAQFETATGLTPGNSYNAEIVYKVTANTGDVFDQRVVVLPWIG